MPSRSASATQSAAALTASASASLTTMSAAYPCARLERPRLEHAEPPGRGDVHQPEAAGGEQLDELLARPLAAAGADEHVQVDELPLGPLVRRRDHALDHEHRRVVPPHDAQDLRRLLVLPVVEDPLQQVGVAARRDRVEEAAARDLAA